MGRKNIGKVAEQCREKLCSNIIRQLEIMGKQEFETPLNSTNLVFLKNACASIAESAIAIEALDSITR